VTAAAPGTSVTPAGSPPFSPEPPVSTIPAADSADFGILREAQGWDDAFGTADETPAGANPELARSVPAPRSALSTGRIWVVPGDDAICLRVLDPSDGDGWVCATAADADSGQLIGALRSSPDDTGPAFVHGLVPDGVDEVTVTGPDGSTTTLPVTDNVYATTLPATPATVTFTLSDGQEVLVDVP
jgi:hypothetical protein